MEYFSYMSHFCRRFMGGGREDRYPPVIRRKNYHIVHAFDSPDVDPSPP